MKKKWIKNLGKNECVGFNNIEEPEKLVELRPDLEILVDVNKSRLSKIVIYPNSVLGSISYPCWGYKHEAVHSGHRIYTIDDLLDFQELDTEPIEKLMGETTEKLKKLLAYRPTLDEDEVNRLRNEHAEMSVLLTQANEMIKGTTEHHVLPYYREVAAKVTELLNRVNEKCDESKS